MPNLDRTAQTLWPTAVRRVALGLALLTASPALGLDLSGRYGVGYEETLTSVGARQMAEVVSASSVTNTATPDVRAGGLSFRWWLGNVGLEGIAGLSLRLPNNAPGEFGGFVSVGALYNLVRTPRVNLSVGGRVLTGLARANNAAGDAGPWRTGFAVELPLRVEYAFTDQFAIGAAVGPTISWSSAQRHPLTGAQNALDVSLTRGDFSGGLGFTYYFGDDDAFAPVVPTTTTP